MTLARYIYRRRFLKPANLPQKIGSLIIAGFDKIIKKMEL